MGRASGFGVPQFALTKMKTLRLNILLIFLIAASYGSAGAGWVKQSTGVLAWFRDIHFIYRDHGFIAGSGGTMLETFDGGRNWSKRRSFTEDNIIQIHFTDPQNGWLLCERNIYNRGTGSLSYLLKSSNGGDSWDRIEFSGGRERIARLFFNPKGAGFAVGESGAIFALGTDGRTWAKESSAMHYVLLGGAFTSESEGVVVGGSGSVYFTEDAGASWKPATVFGKAESRLNSVYFFGLNTGWMAGAEGKVFYTANGGKLWREQSSGITTDLRSIFFVSGSEGWAVGDDGAMIRTTTAGNVWIREDSGTRHKLEKVLFVGKKGFAVGFGGTILTNDPSASPKAPTKAPQLQTRN